MIRQPRSPPAPFARMNPVLLLLLGLAVVLCGILVLRLHAFLALFIGAAVVAVATPGTAVKQFHQTRLEAEWNKAQKSGARMANRPVIEMDEATRSVLERQAGAEAAKPALQRMADGFGSTCAKVGFLIALASIIGRCLLDSGAADRIVRTGLAWLGPGGAPLAFLVSGFVLGIPVFFEGVFLLAIPLAKALWLKLRKDYLLMVLAIIAGGTMTHSLVPPTPGPLFVAKEMGLDLGVMILGGLVVGAFTSSAGFFIAHVLNRRMVVPLRETPEVLAQLEKVAARPDHALPPLARSVIPIVLPLALIGVGASVTGTGQGALDAVIHFLGNENVALAAGALFALYALPPAGDSPPSLNARLQPALEEAGPVILICAAGGAFGAVLQQTGIGPYIQQAAGQMLTSNLWLLPLAFGVTALIRAAQGSATVAMITAVGIVGGLASSGPAALGYHPVYLALAIGCGSKPFPWMNDSGFWVISKMSGMTEAETLKTFSLMLTIMGFVGLGVTMLGALWFPFV